MENPVLRQQSKRVRLFDKSLKKLADDMLETLRKSTPTGVGLAAPQIGVLFRVIVIELPEPEEQTHIIINPEIVKKIGERRVIEGCLSIPGYSAEIKRAAEVTVKGLDLHGNKIRIKAEDLLAQALEHEIDHLNGVLFIDHIESKDNLHRNETVNDNSKTEHSNTI
ncbi:MAG: peptide deformylase [Chloroflexi bacterium]|nr:peptide deformylase [Chloroflexota bacterium]